MAAEHVLFTAICMLGGGILCVIITSAILYICDRRKRNEDSVGDEQTSTISTMRQVVVTITPADSVDKEKA